MSMTTDAKALVNRQDPLAGCRLLLASSEAPQALVDTAGLTLVRLRHPGRGHRPDILVPLCGPASQREVTHLMRSLFAGGDRAPSGGGEEEVPVERPPRHRFRPFPYDRQQFLLLPRAAGEGEDVGDGGEGEAKASQRLLGSLGERLPAAASAAEAARRGGDSASIGELMAFARRFRARREALGYSQGDAALALRRLYGCQLSQTMLSRFELADLTVENMLSLWPLLRRWLADLDARELGGPAAAAGIVAAAASVGVGVGGEGDGEGEDDKDNGQEATAIARLVSDRRRRPRSRHTGAQVAQLERHFLHTPRPSREDVRALAGRAGLSERVVRCWFCNRRQRERRAEAESAATADAVHRDLSLALVAKSQR